jgi:UDP:flavonoid glycosyltransferase YjiC (YdhE family)
VPEKLNRGLQRTRTIDLVAELQRRGFAVAIVTPQELIETIEAKGLAPAEFDTSDWLRRHRALVEAAMREAARAVIVDTVSSSDSSS